jgi:hypothetical protein
MNFATRKQDKNKKYGDKNRFKYFTVQANLFSPWMKKPDIYGVIIIHTFTRINTI